MRNIPAVAPLLRDEVDEYIEKQNKSKESSKLNKKELIDENEIEFESIFEPDEDATLQKANEKTLEMESNLKLAILKRLNQSQQQQQQSTT